MRFFFGKKIDDSLFMNMDSTYKKCALDIASVTMMYVISFIVYSSAAMIFGVPVYFFNVWYWTHIKNMILFDILDLILYILYKIIGSSVCIGMFFYFVKYTILIFSFTTGVIISFIHSLFLSFVQTFLNLK